MTVDAQLPDEPDKSLRERMRVTREEFCWNCHRQMDPLGLPFEQYDHFGRFRTTELEKSVDTSGGIQQRGDERLDGPVGEPLEMIRKLAISERVQPIFMRYTFRYFLKRKRDSDDSDR